MGHAQNKQKVSQNQGHYKTIDVHGTCYYGIIVIDYKCNLLNSLISIQIQNNFLPGYESKAISNKVFY